MTNELNLPLDIELPHGFTLLEQGLFEGSPGANADPTFICSPIWVQCKFADPSGKNWGQIVSLKADDGTVHQIRVGRSELFSKPKDVVRRLLDHGLELAPDKNSANLLIDFLKAARPSEHLVLADHSGWLDHRYSSFIAGKTVIGDLNACTSCNENGLGAAIAVKGSAEDWKTHVGVLCRGNPMMLLAASLAFSGPLLRPLGLHGGGLHFRGASSTGKTTLLSAREDILGFVDYINRNLGAPNKITKDFLLKASLVVCDFDVTYNVKNFTKEAIAEIERNWAGIKRAVENTFRLINKHGIVADNLGSLNAVLPLTYYLYNTPDFDFRGSTEFERMNASAMHYWLLNSLLVGAFSGNSDQTITITRNAIRDHLRLARERDFPTQKLFDAVAKGGRIAQVDSHTIDTILDWEYGKPRTFLALSLLYHGIDWSGSTWHIDHIIPQADAQKSVLRGRNMPEYRIQEMLDSVNRLGNLQLLRAEENVEKGALPFRSWITGRRRDFYDHHMIPERLDMCDIMQLPEFVKEREKLIRKRLVELLGQGPQ